MLQKWTAVKFVYLELSADDKFVAIQLACAVHLARLNPARLILAVRNLEKGEKARQTVLDSKGVSLSPSAVEVWHLDLDSAKGVQAFADKCNNELERLDVLIENAGIATSKWNKTDDGFEQT